MTFLRPDFIYVTWAKLVNFVTILGCIWRFHVRNPGQFCINLRLTEWCLFQHYFSNIAAASSPCHAFQKFPSQVLRTICFPSHRLLSHITIVDTMVSTERRIITVAMTFFNPQNEMVRAGDRSSDPIFKSCTPPTELLGLACKSEEAKWKYPGSVFTKHSQEHPLFFSPRFCKVECNTTSDWLNHTV